MSIFKVTNVIDGDTFDVSPAWNWNNASGTRVRPTGYDAPEVGTYGAEQATRRLERLVLGKSVDLKNVKTITYGRLLCDVFVNGTNLSELMSGY